jgi:fibronectin-binding autotransporter adhesin
MAGFLTRLTCWHAVRLGAGSCLLSALALCAPRPASAITFTWTQIASGNASGSWNTSTNWNAGAGPIASGADNTADFSTLNITTNSTVTLDGNQTIGSLVFGDTNTTSVGNWIVSSGSPSNSTLTLSVISSSPTITTNSVNATINSVIAGTAGLAKQGSGTLILNATNTYSGGTAIGGGTLQIGTGGTSGTLGAGAVTNNGTLAFFRSDSVTVGNAISGSGGAVTQLGTGRIGLSATNSYTGSTTISSGVLQANDGTGLPTASFVQLDGGVLQSDGAASFTRSLGTSGASKFQWTANGGGFSANGGQMAVNIGGAGTEVVWGTTTGSQIVGTLRFGSSTANAKTLFVNGIDLNNVGTSGLSRSINVTAGTGGDSAEISGDIRNSAAATNLVKAGNGLLIFSGANTYTGTTTNSGGTLQIGNAGTSGTLGTGSVVNNASLVFNRSDSVPVGNVISGVGSVSTTGGGVFAFTAANSYLGGTTIGASTLKANNTTGSATGNGIVTINSNGTLAGTVTVNAGGAVAPGNSIGTLAVGGLTLSGATSSLSLEVDMGLTPAADLLNVTGTVSLNNSTLALSVSNVPVSSGPMTFLVVANDSFDSITGTIGTITGTPAGYMAQVNYAYSGIDAEGRVGNGNDMAITLSMVPEVSAAWLGALLCCVLGVVCGVRKALPRLI